MLNDTGVLDNAGTIQIGAGHLGTSLAGYGGVLTVSGMLVNTGLLAAAGTAPGIYPYGAMAAGAIAVSGTLSNDGALLLQSGAQASTLTSNGTLINNGVLSVSGGMIGQNAALTNVGVATNSGLITLTGGGTSAYYEGAYGLQGGYFVNSGMLTNAGTIVVQSGTAASLYGRIGGQGGVLFQSGSLDNTGTLVVQGALGTAGVTGGFGRLSLAGDTTNSGRIQIGAGVFSDGGFVEMSGNLTNTGVITIAGNGAFESGLFQIDGGELLMDGGAIVSTGSFGGQEAVFNGSSVVGTGTIAVAKFGNQGVVSAQDGTLTITGNVTSDGTLEAYFGTLAVYGTIAPHQVVNLQSGVLQTQTGNAGLRITSRVNSTLSLSGGGVATLDARDTDLTVVLTQATVLTLSQMGFLTAIGSSGADTITALAAVQTLEGGAGADRLIGSVAQGDTFAGTAADLNGDTIGNFAGTDVIDVTDLVPGAGLSLSYAQGSGQGQLTLHEGSQSATITLLGTFTQGQFTTGSDGHGGLLIHPGV